MEGGVSHQPLHQAEGLMSSLLRLKGLDLLAPDHTTLSKRYASFSISKVFVRHKTAAPDEPIPVLATVRACRSMAQASSLKTNPASRPENGANCTLLWTLI
ncbi:transposase [Brucella gallinifaecis]|uniref:transposase n=1 Tax=Brucella gallinifaecis TaxID=215590 RepID=UPI002360CC7D|nr:transposase [Brucella gallinifaecis]